MFKNKRYYHVIENGIIIIKGDDKFEFIQSIISNDINILKKNISIYSSLLSPHGKFLCDFFISIKKKFFFIESHKANIPELLNKLSLYKIKSKVEIAVNEKISIFLMNNNEASKINKELKSEISLSFIDPRFGNFSRVYTEKNIDNIFSKFSMNKISLKSFEDLRLKNFIPNFNVDCKKNESLLLELRFEDLNGISFEKGCYIGQEITARMKYRALVKKKIFGTKIYFKSFLESEIKLKNKTIGELMSHNKKYGLAIINVNDAQVLENEKFICGDSILEISIPWWSN